MKDVNVLRRRLVGSTIRFLTLYVHVDCVLGIFIEAVPATASTDVPPYCWIGPLAHTPSNLLEEQSTRWVWQI